MTMLPGVLLAFGLLGQSPAPPTEPTTLLILPLVARGGVSTDLTQLATAALAAETARMPGYRVATFTEVERTLSAEQVKIVSGCTTESCALEIAAALNTDQLVFGEVGKVETELVLSLARVSRSNGAVVARVFERFTGELALLKEIPRVTRQLLDEAPPPAAPQTLAAAAPMTPAPPAVPAPPTMTTATATTAPAEPPGWTDPTRKVLLGVVLVDTALLVLAVPALVLSTFWMVLLLPSAMNSETTLRSSGPTGATLSGGLLPAVFLPLFASLGTVFLLLLPVLGGSLVGLVVVRLVGGPPASDEAPRAEATGGTAAPPTSRRTARTARARARVQRGDAPLPDGLPYCQSGLDCEGGAFCKSWVDDVKVCMGNGHHGDPCDSGLDCSGGNFCKDPGDGRKVCMGEGRRGEVCNSGLDCEGGRFCKDRGDGLKVCM